jgi:DMSO reductase iron-sulfur subunit
LVFGLGNERERHVEYGLLVSIDRCVGCHACELACAAENQLTDGVRWRHIVKAGPSMSPSGLQLSFMSISCMHCGQAPCMQVCPVKAISKRPDGIVMVDDKKCIGCKACLWICPFGAPQFNPRTGRMSKCHLCYHRVEKGQVPACVASCHVEAIQFGTTAELAQKVHLSVLNRASAAKGSIATP